MPDALTDDRVNLPLVVPPPIRPIPRYTHAEALALPKRPPSLIPTACEESLVHNETFPDRSPGPDGQPVDALVDLYLCAACSTWISIRAGRVLNAYKRPEVIRG